VSEAGSDYRNTSKVFGIRRSKSPIVTRLTTNHTFFMREENHSSFSAEGPADLAKSLPDR
jgi:peptide methionine sulfoxide reductase MsrA